jgi:hypothetical protein
LFEYITPRLVIISDGPECETSATALYRHRDSEGWLVYDRRGGRQTRWVLTTRQDGVIAVKFGINAGIGTNYLNVTAD